MLSQLDSIHPFYDENLPGLDFCFDSMKVSTLVERNFSKSQNEYLQLNYIRYKPNRRCVCLYRSLTGGSSRFSGPEMVVVNSFTAEGFAKRCKKLLAFPSELLESHVAIDVAGLSTLDRFPFDPILPAIHKFYDPEHRSRMIRRIIGNKYDTQQSVIALAYKPARRFVATCAGEKQFVVKFYSRPQYTQTASRLKQLDLDSIDAPEILGVCQRYRAIAYQWQTGQPLMDHICDPVERAHLFFQIGSKLGQLHGQKTDLIATDTSQVQLRNIGDDLKIICSELGNRACSISEEIIKQLAETSPSFSTIHGDFYTKQIVVSDGDVKFIDFDQCHVADRYIDLGNFIGQLYWRSLLNEFHRSWIGEAIESFLNGYARSYQYPLDRHRFSIQVAAALIRCVLHPFRHAMDEWQQATASILDAASGWVKQKGV